MTIKVKLALDSAVALEGRVTASWEDGGQHEHHMVLQREKAQLTRGCVKPSSDGSV